MYFCPCSCSKPDCENEDDVLICLPRNLSYAGESCLDRYSVSSAFVHNSKLEKQLLQADVGEHYLKAGAAACAELKRIEEKERGRRGGKEEEEEEEEEAGDSDHLLGARAMAARPLTYSDESSSFFRKGGPDHCDVIVDTAPTFSLSVMSLQQSPPPTPDPDPDDSLSTSSSPPFQGDVSDLHPPSPPQLTVTIVRGGDKSSPSNDTNIITSSTTTTTATTQQSALFDRYVVHKKPTESPDSDLVSEEGIFLNMMDDLDGLNGEALGGKSTLSEASDDTYVSGDSMYYSPQDVDDMEDEDQIRGQDLRVSLEEAVQQVAAFVFRSQSPPPPLSSEEQDTDCCAGTGDDNSEVVVFSLTYPHANDGESENCGGQSCGADFEVEKSEDLHPPAYSASPVLQVVPTSSNDSASNGESNTDVRPQSPKSPSSLGIRLSTDMAATVSLLNADGGDSRGHQLNSSFHDLLSPNSPVYDDREFNFQRTELRKSTSLKSTKTPPGTPRRKKVVRFADAMGLDLESVRHVLNLESPPKIPASAMKDLHPGLSEDRKAMGSKYITETFPQPGVDPRFRERVMAEKVVLENALIVSGSITGVVRVANIGFHKSVRVRFTTNSWASFHDIAASYMVNSNDGPSDRFSFTLVPPPDFCPGSRLEFAISYSVNGTDFWDNNYGKNYTFECYAKSVPTEAENAWMHFL